MEDLERLDRKSSPQFPGDVAGERIRFDFAGTSRQVTGNINVTLNATQAAVCYTLKALLDRVERPANRDVAELRDAKARLLGQGADKVRHSLDLYLPKGQKDFPVVVLVHGGAWMVGDEAAGLGDAPWPPHFRKQEGEPKRVQPSRAKKD